MNTYAFYVYITTNLERTVLYTGMTNDLTRRMDEHRGARGKAGTFAGRFYCYNLIYWEFHPYVHTAIEREKEIKGWIREKKIALIGSMNPDWRFLNDEL